MVRALEVVDTEDRDHLRMREQYWINQHECVNQAKAYMNDEERKERMNMYRRYYEKNKDKEKARKRMYKEKRSEWESTWKLDGRKIDATNLLVIDPSLFD